MQCESGLTLGIGDPSQGDYGDIIKAFVRPGQRLEDTRFLYADYSSKVFHRMPLDDREDARRFWAECINH